MKKYVIYDKLHDAIVLLVKSKGPKYYLYSCADGESFYFKASKTNITPSYINSHKSLLCLGEL